MIKISRLKKVYKSDIGNVTALENVNLEIGNGDIYGIIGLSGAGKSTLIRCINLLEYPTEGIIEIDGQDITKLHGNELSRFRQSTGMIFQHFNLLMQRRPVISEMVLQYGVLANILYGNVDYIQGKPVGELVLDLSGENEAIMAAVNYLKDLKLLVEELDNNGL